MPRREIKFTLDRTAHRAKPGPYVYSKNRQGDTVRVSKTTLNHFFEGHVPEDITLVVDLPDEGGGRPGMTADQKR